MNPEDRKTPSVHKPALESLKIKSAIHRGQTIYAKFRNVCIGKKCKISVTKEIPTNEKKILIPGMEAQNVTDTPKK